MKKHPILLFVLCALTLSAGIGVAQVYLNPVSLVDVKASGSGLGYFHKTPSVKSWDFQGVSNARVSGSVLIVGDHWAPMNPDLGVTVGAKGVQVGTGGTRPTCVAALRGTHYTTWLSTDLGPDTSAQCCRAQNGTYSWVAGYCQ